MLHIDDAKNGIEVDSAWIPNELAIEFFEPKEDLSS